MTGELTLSGLVMPIGGLKEKIIAAIRAKLKYIILPRENRMTSTPATAYQERNHCAFCDDLQGCAEDMLPVNTRPRIVPTVYLKTVRFSPFAIGPSKTVKSARGHI